MTTNAFRAKRALIDLLKGFTGEGELLEGVDVVTSWRGDLGLKAIYGGGVGFVQQSSVAEQPGLLMNEDAVIHLYAHVVHRPPTDEGTDATDAELDDLWAAVGEILIQNPKFGGGFSFVGIQSGDADYNKTDDDIRSLGVIRIVVNTQLTYGVD